MTRSYPFHPIADKFPLLEGREFDDLVNDIAAHGQLEPLVLYEGKILDGRNRYRACLKLGKELRTQTMSFPTREAARDYVISTNAHRRHLLDKYKVIEELLTAFPDLSDRAIAKEADTNPMKVGRVRKRMGTSVAASERVGLDGKTRTVPERPAPIAETVAQPASTQFIPASTDPLIVNAVLMLRNDAEQVADMDLEKKKFRRGVTKQHVAAALDALDETSKLVRHIKARIRSSFAEPRQ